MDIIVDLLQWFINFLIKTNSVSSIKNIPNKEFAEELHKPIIRTFNKKSTLTFYR